MFSARLRAFGRRAALVVVLLVVAVLVPACSTSSEVPEKGKADLLWDEWGVPHIYAGDDVSLFRAFGSAQMQSHANLLLRLIAQARGEAAAYGGEEFVDSDRAVHVMGLRERGQQWYDEQEPAFRSDVDAFAAGMSAYADTHRDQLDPLLAPVLPITGPDVMAHVARTMFTFVASSSGCEDVLAGDGAASRTTSSPGSNGWAIGPDRTTDGVPLLLANPHLSWGGEQLMYEAHLVTSDMNLYGAALVGFPTIVLGFTDRIGWTHTVNPIDACDIYGLTTSGNGYRYDGAVRPFETRADVLRVRGTDGTTQDRPLPLRWSVQGPVVTKAGRTGAIRITSVGATSTPGLLQQWWDMAHARDLDGFRAVLARNQLPMFNVLYAGQDKHVFAAYAGQIPQRPEGYNGRWDGVVPGDTSATMWTDVLAFDRLPQVVDPPGGFVQNSNSAPWSFTLPRAPQLNPGSYPRDLPGEGITWRERRGLQMIEDNPHMSLDDLVRLKYDTRMALADRVLPELLAAARETGDADARQAADVLEAWDRQANADSTGALLFLAWTVTVLPGEASADKLFSTLYDPLDPLNTPRDLADKQQAVKALGEAARLLRNLTGSLDVPWGKAERLQRGTVDLPGNGFPGDPYGVFRVLAPDLSVIEDGKPAPTVFGDSFVAAVEFTDPVRARVLTTYGNSTQPGSPHNGDQLDLSSRGQLRVAWLTREDVEQHVRDRQSFG